METQNVAKGDQRIYIESVQDKDPNFGVRTYRLNDGRVLFSVTGLLEHLVPPRLMSYVKRTDSKTQDLKLESTANIGLEIEGIVINDLMGIKQEVKKQFEPHFENWLKIKREHEIRGILTQTQVYSLKYGFAGRLDLYGYYEGRPAIMDVKSGYVGVKAGMQEVAYGQALSEMTKNGDFQAFDYVTLPIHRNGTFKEPLKLEHKDWVFRQFLNCLQSFKGIHFYRLKKLDWPWLMRDAHEEYFNSIREYGEEDLCHGKS